MIKFNDKNLSLIITNQTQVGKSLIPQSFNKQIHTNIPEIPSDCLFNEHIILKTKTVSTADRFDTAHFQNQ